MIQKIHVVKYRKLSDIDITLSKNVNIISGTNGTCKTSLLHIISNSFQALNRNCAWVTDPTCLNIIKQINSVMNPKIESLTKGDKTHNDPANGVEGTIFSVDYYGHTPIEFRRHNSKLNARYAVKPYYRPGTTEKLPFCPVIYLGLARLYPFGEYLNDGALQKLRKNLPQTYQDEIAELYRNLSGISISSVSPQRMGDIKTRAEFKSSQDGVDSNTISAGEDNLFIILSALISLKYYFNNITSTKEVESVLLIDEFDATLHPSLQERLLEIFRRFSSDYKIQIVFTTHSLSTVEVALKKHDNVIYIVDNISNAVIMDEPDIYKIKRHLMGITGDDIYSGKSIPLFTEDKEARLFLEVLFDYFAETHEDFVKVKNYFHFVDASVGATNLRAIFSDSYLLQTTMKCACILDGDQTVDKGDLNKYIITLPGGDSPEKVIMTYAQTIYDNDASFWTDPLILELNYGKVHFRDEVKPDIDNVTHVLQERRDAGESIHGIERELRKKVFTDHQRFFELLFKYWVRDEDNADTVNRFYKSLNIIFKKLAGFHGIDSKMWTIE